VDFTRPDDQQFSFNPPPGAKVTQAPAPTDAQREQARTKAEQARADASDDGTVVGEGWTAIWLGKADVSSTAGSAGSAGSAQDDQLQGVLAKLPKESGSWGSGRVLRGTLFSAVLTDDGRVAVGAVKPSLLFAALDR